MKDDNPEDKQKKEKWVCHSARLSSLLLIWDELISSCLGTTEDIYSGLPQANHTLDHGNPLVLHMVWLEISSPKIKQTSVASYHVSQT